jgi:hypothetical protein
VKYNGDEGPDRDFNEDDNQDEGEFTFGQGTGAELLELESEEIHESY